MNNNYIIQKPYVYLLQIINYKYNNNNRVNNTMIIMIINYNLLNYIGSKSLSILLHLAHDVTLFHLLEQLYRYELKKNQCTYCLKFYKGVISNVSFLHKKLNKRKI